MSNSLFAKGRNRFAKGELVWKEGGDHFRCFLIDLDSYTPDLLEDEYLSDVPSAARYGNLGRQDREDAPLLSLYDPVDGVCDADNTTFTAVPAGATLEALLIFQDSGDEETSALVALIDTAAGLPITTNGADISISWDDGSNKIFKL